MEKKALIDLLIRYHEKNLSGAELACLQDFLAHERSSDLLIEVLEELSEKHDQLDIPTIQEEKIFSEIWRQSQHLEKPVASRKKRNIFILGSISAAALLLIFMNLSRWFNFYSENNKIVKHEVSNTSPIIPGGTKATLILENGETLHLENLANDTTILLNGYKIHKNKSGKLSYILTAHGGKKQYNTIITPKGGEYQLSLPDGTSMWVNSSSKVKYPLEFDPEKREVEVEGEAYFEVAKKKNQEKHIPFLVYTRSQTLEVLGTTFNINAYKADIQTTLIEGKVKLTYPGQKEHYLSPNQQAIFTPSTNQIAIKEVDPFYFIAWKSGAFAFENATLQDVMENLGRWYEITIAYQTDVSNLKFSGTISKYEKIEKVLDLIEMTGSVHFKIEERRVIVMK